MVTVPISCMAHSSKIVARNRPKATEGTVEGVTPRGAGHAFHQGKKGEVRAPTL
jgi:hypothetical protein